MYGQGAVESPEPPTTWASFGCSKRLAADWSSGKWYDPCYLQVAGRSTHYRSNQSLPGWPRLVGYCTGSLIAGLWLAKKSGVLIFKLIRRGYNAYLSPDRHIARRIKQITGFTPSNLKIFKLAFAHKSTQHNGKDSEGNQNNERLEFLGDAVLGTIVAEYLYQKYPSADEGFLTKMRSKIVKRKSLNKIGDSMGVDMLLNEFNNTRISRSMMGNAVEALVGAVYIERGYRGTYNFIVRRMLRKFVDVHELEQYDDNFKSQLLEHCQKNGQNVSYKLISRYKMDKRDRFKVGVIINGDKIAVADDFNKKAAEQQASERALHKLGLLNNQPKE
jgi:ribonuclease-3